jgi:hypothetical protein
MHSLTPSYSLDEPIPNIRITDVGVQIGLEGDEFDSALDYAADQGWFEDAEMGDSVSWVSLTPAGVAAAKNGMPEYAVAAAEPRLGGEAMATAADYRKWAEECFEWARQASDESVREQYASLGRVWLDCLRGLSFGPAQSRRQTQK